MLLRASSEKEQGRYDLNSVTSDSLDPGVPHGKWLRRLTEAAIRGDWLTLADVRPQAEAAMGHQQTVDALTVAAAFNGITRVADAAVTTVDLRASTGIEHFAYDNKSARYSAG